MRTSIRTLLLALSLLAGVSHAQAQSTAFTYQGRFNTNGAPYTGSAEFQFTLWDAVSGGNAVATNNPVAVVASVSAGLFTATLEFGSPAFNGQPRFLQIDARTTIGAFTTLTPRQPLTPTPYALRALNLTTNGLTAGTYTSAVTLNNAGNSFNGSYTGNGGGLTNLNATTLGGLTSSNFWHTTGDAGTTSGTHFLGTTDNQPLEIKVNGLRALRVENNGDSLSDPDATPDGAPNLIAGSPLNRIAVRVVGATIAGGGATNYSGVAYSNSIASDFAVIGGGYDNDIASSSAFALIAGGSENDIGTDSAHSVIGGGNDNNIAPNVTHGVIAGGFFNDIGDDSDFAAILGGNNNNILSDSDFGAIGGGGGNTINASSPYSVIGGGRFNRVRPTSNHGVIAGGAANEIGTNSPNSAIGGGTNNYIGTGSPYASIGGGLENRIGPNVSGGTIAGGGLCFVGADYSTIGGGIFNGIYSDATRATIAGGAFNEISADSQGGAIGGGEQNIIPAFSQYATIPGGLNNLATDYAFAAGRRAKAIHQGSFVWGDSFDGDVGSTTTNQFTVRASRGVRFFSNTALSAGVSLAAGGTSWGVISDRNVKKNFQPVNSREVLERLVALPVTRWNYQWEADDDVPHLGPMAQDFKGAFYPGGDDKVITTQEMDGVALAAIQGLNQKLEETRVENADLKRRLEALEKILQEKSR